MPSINHLANNHLAARSQSSQKRQLKSQPVASPPQFGMHSAPSADERPGCLERLMNCFRNLVGGGRRPAAVSPDNSPLQKHIPRGQNHDYLSFSDTAPPLTRESSVHIPVQEPTVPKPKTESKSSLPIPIVRKSDSNHKPEDDGLPPFTPPEVTRQKQKMQRLLADKF